MSLYPDARALVADAQLRLDRFGPSAGILVVEGPDDKRFFCTRTRNRQQVVAAGGRRILLSAHDMVLTEDRSGIAFLTDCDYEVPLGTLNPRPNLVITENAALEADLFEAGGFEEIVVQLVPAALNDDEVTLEFAAQLKDRSVALAEALGRIRRVAKEHAFPLDLDNFRHHKYRKSGSSIVDVDKMVRAVIQASREATLTATEVADRVEKIPSSYSNCNGHDLVAAVAHVLREDFGVRGHTEDTVAAILRNSFIGETFERLRIVDRLRRWEVGNSRQLFI